MYTSWALSLKTPKLRGGILIPVLHDPNLPNHVTVGGVPHSDNGAQGYTDRQAWVYRQQTGSCAWN